VYLEQHRVGPPGEKVATSLATRVRLGPVKGYRKPLRKAVALLRETLKLSEVADDLLDEALAALGSTPGEYTSKLRLQLEPGMPAIRAVKNVLLRLLETMQANEAGTIADLDSEFLHDFRVSVRRTRSALSQLKGVLPEEIEQRFRPEFAWLGLITGPTRDLDVYLLKLPAYRAALPPSVRQDLGPLYDFLVAQQRKEQQTLARQLRSKRYRRLVAEWRAVLESSAETETGPANARRPVEDVAAERIWKMFRRAIREGRAIGPGSPAEMLHALRKTCKKLRYLLEFFQSLYPQHRIRQLIKALKVLQDNLGDFQDLEVQSAALTSFSRQMAAEQDVAPETLLAMGMLVEDLRRRQHQVRDAFSARFVAFSSPQNRKRFQELFVCHSAEPERPA
jgi:CHAD domain-containing protein